MSAKKKRPAKTGAKKAAAKPARRTRAPRREREEGPREWLMPLREATYAQLVPRGAPARPRVRGMRSAIAPAVAAGAVVATPAQDVWVDQLAEYKRRKAESAVRARAAAPPAFGVAPTAPIVPGGRNWSPLGPSTVTGGQAKGRPAVAGRISGIAVAPGGQIVYAASANGGVFRSDDAGVSWRSLMDAFDLDPTNFASTSLACGAIAIPASDPERVYVGTGEGDTHQLFASRLTNSLPAYRGIGPIRSDDGGANWEQEATAAASPSLAGKAFFALAVDPANPDHVIAATTEGLYQRVMVNGTPEWTRRKPNVFSSVIATVVGGATRFYAAEWGKGVYRSQNGQTWTAVNSGFPATGVGRIALAAHPANARVVYAFVVNARGAMRGVFRLDVAGGTWKTVRNLPDVLPVDGGASQGDYDLAIAVDPLNDNIIYLGGSYYNNPDFWPASIWRCNIAPSGTAFRATGTSIGEHAHADVHVLTHTPGDPNQLWTGCDGGVFLNRNPRSNGVFAARNDGLSCLCPNFIAQHPTDPNIIFAGLQDNGTARTGGNPAWKWVNGGDGGYCLINWATPNQVLIFANGTVYRTTTGGDDETDWTEFFEFPWQLMTEPIVGPPYNPASPNDAKTVALGVGTAVHISNDFGKTWKLAFDLAGSSGVFALAFASPTRLFAGTTRGEVFRADKSGTAWTVDRIDDAAAGALGLTGLVTDIAIDWADPSLQSVYLAFGGMGDFRHVWHFDGTRWTPRSGAPGSDRSLLDVEHNALVVDRTAAQNLYVGADIGVWHSADSGATWSPLSNGLPDAPVFDLGIHPTQRLLRAATHGRGVYEIAL